MHLNIPLTLTVCLPLALALPPRPVTMTMVNPKIPRSTNQTLGHATILNSCASEIYLWSVGSTIAPQLTLPPNTTYTEPYRRDPASGGIALKLTRVQNGLYTAAPQMVFAYNLVQQQIWYDLSDVFGDPFYGSRVRVEYRSLSGEEGGDEEEKGIEWVDGVSPGGSMVRVADAQGDLLLTVC
ncbi:hydroxyacid-oxoacid transhydrogenase, mitochondrial [Aspergillus udagawae]|uniref:Hydroxyacid-oxoacid transhydrogenase, mitochondrial n=1 Tax=Aspergillus udagawae TaxID=91492 RepID=A0ABQ1B0V5_9EURO|nr:hydroxyacid-oxoacid transhydrogenase, mitochondrial [Aspergillus udagawae]GFF91668.1 hydroxyacid-oxoacid transhydrogenase, mitochondrial [Aspergillus udagawae]GFG15999.1 hydroxyacid-oxoacid transhydrogenase, mitochondrial [Aspergillus udagawae]GFG26950.1 hydroxyacid-oxoacid transhydrogenase, mitochondrial [Aspergillus udagawae]